MKWDKLVGSAWDQPTLAVKRLVEFKSGRRIDLHRMLRDDEPECFHTHPGEAVRIILFGWYVEQMEDGKFRLWLPGMIGVVRRTDSHRIAAASKRCFTLWLRGREHIPVELRGKGWKS